MSVTRVEEIGLGRQGGFNNTESTSTRVFRVWTNNSRDDDQTILASGLIPIYNSQHPRNPNLFARSFQARQEHPNFVWIVTIGYDNRNLAAGLPKLATEAQYHPMFRRVKIRGKTVHTKEPWTQGRLIDINTISGFNNGVGAVMPGDDELAPVANSANDPFESLEEEIEQFMWEITWNVDQLPFWVADFAECVNMGPVFLLGRLFPRWTLKVRGFNHSDLMEEQIGQYLIVRYIQISFEIHYKRDMWVRRVADRGYRKLVDGAQKKIYLTDGTSPTVPVLLNGVGAVLSDPTPETTQYLWFGPRGGERDFTPLRIPAIIPA